MCADRFQKLAVWSLMPLARFYFVDVTDENARSIILLQLDGVATIGPTDRRVLSSNALDGESYNIMHTKK